MKTEPNREYKDHNQGESRYMTSVKKRYYLASVDENVQMLIKEQINELTNVLIGLKSEYDALTRESTIKNRETEELGTKIKMLQKMDQKSKKKYESTVHMNDALQEALDTKQIKLEEEKYERKTLLSQIDKLKSDCLVTRKTILQKENVTKRIRKDYEKVKTEETVIKEQHNNVYSKIQMQNKKNKFDQNEQNLQLQYYNTIIDQKNAFLRSADERKERQLKIAQEAKNDSQDKQEITKRIQLCLLSMIDKHLKYKMESELEANEKLEETFQEIRDICGTANLKVMVEKILNKDKRYNSCVAKVSEKEGEIEILEKDIAELEEQLIGLKTAVLVKESDNEKVLSTIPVSIIEKQENELIKEEIHLKKVLMELQEKHKTINLIYEKVTENMTNLSKEEMLNITQARTEQGEQTITEIQEDANVTTANVDTALPNESQPQQQQEKEQEEQQEGEKEKEEEGEQNEEKVREEGQEQKETQQEEPAQAQTQTQSNVIVQAQTTPAITYPNMTVKEKKLQTCFEDFLHTTSKKFDKLFLCHTKHEFLNMMREKGVEMPKEISELPKASKRPAKQTKTIRVKTEGNMNEDCDLNDPSILVEEKKEQKLIFNAFLSGMKMKKDEFTHVNKKK